MKPAFSRITISAVTSKYTRFVATQSRLILFQEDRARYRTRQQLCPCLAKKVTRQLEQRMFFLAPETFTISKITTAQSVSALQWKIWNPLQTISMNCQVEGDLVRVQQAHLNKYRSYAVERFWRIQTQLYYARLQRKFKQTTIYKVATRPCMVLVESRFLDEKHIIICYHYLIGILHDL